MSRRLASARARLARPHHQIELLLALFVVSGILVLVTGLARLQGVQSGLNRLNGRLAPESSLLERAVSQYSDSFEDFQRLLATGDPTLRSADLTAAAKADTTANATWEAYRRGAVGLPNEAQLQARFVADLEKLTQAGTGLFGATTDPSFRDTYQTTFSALRADLVSLTAVYDTASRDELSRVNRAAGATQRDALRSFVAALALLLTVGGLAIRSARRRERADAIRDAASAEQARRNNLETRLQRSYEMAGTEEASYDVVGEALAETGDGLESELLVADSSRAHFRRVASNAPPDGATEGCPVGVPGECPAAVRGQTFVFPSSSGLGVCPHLRGRPRGPCSAVCIPLATGGKTVGVFHATASDHEPPDSDAVATLELIARKTGERLGMLRAFARSEAQARTDPLTGLFNRRSLETQVHELVRRGVPYVVAFGDLDRFKDLNDVHGHDTGDRALRLFARVLRDNVRPNDVPARYGGEEFVIVLPDCSIAEAVGVLERVRERLRNAFGGELATPFTVSFGVASSMNGAEFATVVESADRALLTAKGNGRDRVVVDPADRPETGDARQLHVALPTAG